eukprot:scaffold272176_cov43-Tisochrysis_lutea.AAC.1
MAVVEWSIEPADGAPLLAPPQSSAGVRRGAQIRDIKLTWAVLEVYDSSALVVASSAPHPRDVGARTVDTCTCYRHFLVQGRRGAMKELIVHCCDACRNFGPLVIDERGVEDSEVPTLAVHPVATGLQYCRFGRQRGACKGCADEDVLVGRQLASAPTRLYRAGYVLHKLILCHERGCKSARQEKERSFCKGKWAN